MVAPSAPTPVTFSESRLDRVPIFSVGIRKGKYYGPADLDQMVENFRRFSAPDAPKRLLEVPSVLGHEETQEYLRRSDLPAAAWNEHVWREGPTLYADMTDVAPEVMRLIKGQRYKYVSAEIYDSPPEGIPGSGKMLRRVAFLGGDIPAVKGLGEIPLPATHSEGFAPALPVLIQLTPANSYQAPAGPGGTPCWACFSEVTSMDRNALLEALAKHGCSVEALREAPDAVLAEMLRVCESKGKSDLMDEWPAPKDEREKMAYGERCRKMAEHARGMAKKHGLRFDEETTDKDRPKPPEPPLEPSGAEKKLETAFNEMVRKFREEVARGTAEYSSLRNESLAAEKARTIDAFLETHKRAGRLSPAEEPSLRKRLLRADSRAVVERFSEGGRAVEKSELDLQMDEIRSRSTRFSEVFQDPVQTATQPADRKAWAEATFQKFSESFEAIGSSRADFVAVCEKADDTEYQRIKAEWERIPAGTR